MEKLLGEHLITVQLFDDLDRVIKKLKGSKEKIDRKKSDLVNRTLLELIQNEKEPSFLLAAVLNFVKRVDDAKILQHYTFTSFEIWLNQYSGLSFEENLAVRAKIVGKKIERGDYQTYFPIGMGKVYEGTHFVTAHKSPDLDTTIASFWGWVDAFGARVGDSLHIWNLPEGPPASQIEIEWMFRDLFGEAVFTHLPKMRTILNLNANDLMTQKGLQKMSLNTSIADIEHDLDENAVVVVDDKGFFLGDWRISDVEGVRQVIISLATCLRWFENALHLNLISVFAREQLRISHVEDVLKKLLSTKLESSEPALEFSTKQAAQVEHFMQKVLGMKKGLKSNFEELAVVLSKLGDVSFGGIDGLLEKMKGADLFDAKGNLIDERPRIFSFLEGIIHSLHKGIVKIRSRMEKLDIALETKYKVFGRHPNTVTTRSEVEEIRNKMGPYSYLTVVYPDRDKMYPVGVVQAAYLRKPVLGTVSLRDFCNRAEMGIPAYLDVISVIDHHKSELNTFGPPAAVVSDAQSTNTMVAQKAFEINDSNRKKPNYIHPQREFIEYLHFLYGIIDDTDLLTKVSALDVQIVASLLNRLKSLATGKKTVLIKVDDLPRDRAFPKKVAKRILQNADMYSLYRKVFQFREKEVEKNLTLCARGEESNLFADTKEQNGCCRVGQTKIFASNVRHFEKLIDKIRHSWLQKAKKIYREKEEFNLHIHMISTIVSAEEVYRGSTGKYRHKDEMWIWIPDEEVAIEQLKRFLNAFQNSNAVKNNSFELEFLGANADELARIFKESFIEIPKVKRKKDLPIAVLRYKAGTLNSRKAMISPYLPKRSS
ncbi:MAG: hypothetical protein K1X28_06135 [Parachlamydiales bacterium]|nr:hypothetical protein [Parachlamydiales bacterium]